MSEPSETPIPTANSNTPSSSSLPKINYQELFAKPIETLTEADIADIIVYERAQRLKFASDEAAEAAEKAAKKSKKKLTKTPAQAQAQASDTPQPKILDGENPSGLTEAAE